MRILTMPLRASSDELIHLDVVRFIASWGIVFIHSESFIHITPKIDRILPRIDLSLFVDVFFVISGFVISYVYADKITSITSYFRFILKRIARLGPLHWAMLLVFVFIGVILNFTGIHTNHPESYDFSRIPTEFFLMNAENFCPHLAFNGASWSIGAEMVMYVLFPLLSLQTRSNKIIMLTVIIVLVLSFIYQHQRLGDITSDYGALRAFPSFLLGILLFRYRDIVGRLPVPNYFLWLSVIVFFTAAFWHLPSSVILLIGYSIAISAVAADSRKVVVPRVIEYIGAAGQLTYSVYMIHGVFILLIPNYIGDKILHLRGVLTCVLMLMTYLIIMLTSYISFTFFETPARIWMGNLGLPRKISQGPD